MLKNEFATLLTGGAVALLMAVSLAGCADGSGSGGPEPGNGAETGTPAPAIDTGVPGVTDDRILFGQSAAFEGPAAELGNNMRLGIRAAFAEVNRAGGVHGRQIELVSFNDSYEPDAAIANTTRLINEDKVFALIGAVGTPTSRSATPIAREAGIPYIAPFTGAEFLRDDEWPNIVNLRASYYQETEEMVARLIGDLGITRIGVMYQDDSYGRAGYRGVRQALERRDMTPVSVGLYPRNTLAVKTALLDLQKGSPEAIIQIGAYQPVAELILWAKQVGMDTVFLNVSFVGSNALANKLGPKGEGVYVTQVVPFPSDKSVPVVSRYIDALAAFEPEAEPGFVSLEGYLAGRLVIESLEKCGREVRRSCMTAELANVGEFDIDGFRLKYGEGDNQGSDRVFLTVIGSDSRYHPIESLGDSVP